MAQSNQLANAQAKPRLALRVGITGARSLETRRLSDIHAKVRVALTCIRDEMMSLAHDPDVGRLYAVDDKKVCVPFLRIVSPLALGADRLVAEEALALGYKLYVPMPFSRAEYEHDFTGTDPAKAPNALPMTAAEDIGQFRTLLERAGEDWMSLDGDYDQKQSGRDEQRNRAYEAVGRFVVRNSDIVVAIWNGELAAGRGGTQQVVDYAASVGVPVWWIHATVDTDPRWIADVHDARDPLSAALAVDSVPTYLCQQILGPKPIARDSKTLLAWLARPWQSETVDPAEDYFKEQPLPDWFVWRLYTAMMLFASGYKPSAKKPKKRNASGYWFERYRLADARAGEYAARYRSSYVWIFLLTTLSLTFGAVANAFHGRPNVVVFFALFECVALLTTLGIAVGALCCDWHEHSIEYRLLAELCRKQQVLGLLGRAISFGAVRRLAAQIQEAEDVAPQAGARDSSRHKRPPDRAVWVSWLFMAYQRAAPLPRGDIAALLPGVLSDDVLQDLVNEQLEYHETRAEMTSAAAEFFETWGGRIFVFLVFGFRYEILWYWRNMFLYRCCGRITNYDPLE